MFLIFKVLIWAVIFTFVGAVLGILFVIALDTFNFHYPPFYIRKEHLASGGYMLRYQKGGYSYYNEEHQLHRLDGPAHTLGYLRKKRYFINGKEMSAKQFKSKYMSRLGKALRN